MKSPAAMARSSNLYAARPARGVVRRSLFARPAFTLVEVLVATAITLLLMAGIVTLFASVSETISRGQAMMETGDRLRAMQHRLQTDLRNITAPLVPLLDPRDGRGYVEFVEDPGPYLLTGYGIQALNTENGNIDDTTVGGRDTVMFTTRSYGEPFIGRWGVGGAFQSQVAEICWFLRGTTLYRRVLLVTPERTIPDNWYNGMYYFADVSVHQEGGGGEPNLNWGAVRLVPNSLGDLTKRENRYGHWPRHSGNALQGFPHDVRMWGQLGLPTLRESSDPGWPFPLFGNAPTMPSPAIAAVNQNDFWVTPYPWANVDAETGAMNAYIGNRNPERVAEDVILNNVLSFDVKVWDPLAPVLRDASNPVQVLEPGDPGYRLVLQSAAGAIQTWVNNGRPTNSVPPQVVRLGAYVDLYYTRGIAAAEYISSFSHAGDARSGLRAGLNTAAIWDTYPTHYEYDGVDQDGNGIVDDANDGLDNNNGGGVDDASERETAPPYDAPIRSIQIKIRVFERDSRQIREVTVTQDFVP